MIRDLFLRCLIPLLLSAGPAYTQDAPPPPETEINIAFDLWPGYYPLIIAEQQGYFQKYQLNVKSTYFDSVSNLQTRFIHKQFDAVCIALGDIFSLLEQQPNARIILIADLSAGGDALLSLSPLAKNRSNLRIGINVNGFGELFIREFLNDYNYQIEDITLVNVDASQTTQLLLSKQVDIIHSWEPFVTDAVNAGARILYTSRQTPGLLPDVVAFHGDFLNQQPQAAKNFTKAWFEAVEWWLNNPIAGNAMIEKALKLDKAINLKDIKLMSYEDNLDAFNNPNSARSLSRVLNRYIEFFTQKNVITNNLNAGDIINSSFLTPPAK
ncbi:ABC transporter substrate-binding protein [Dasania sp. GY-MA-18]|uniref:ABC transporter substrate-binding protein n=1 Tax=Dasania phycosphaerae TaxID=2950436 RepID=A0A9J6RQY8_9GAMM|nr:MULTISPECIES: ABC transporter substrate-binding protein [Dasania]MCR8924231.1 ABC transporter substrate-binding protein [Dasania sp. GY-MA-18]MCZ0866884.1 ABC transporter substrate-binding protein [Dasania phycosphaerae]MCZ0870388.1 ABC transporter substrate-binding protein [Dasania phycosphaerae]